MLEYVRPTDKEHEIELSSAITHALWGRQQVSVGEMVSTEVYTHFVGNGSEVRITVRSKTGKRLDRFEGKVYGNRFKGTYTVSDKAKDAIYFEAELKKHGLKQESEEMEIIPPIEITNLQWNQQEARRGDILTLTADVSGAPDVTEATIEIYEHDADEAHDFITRFPTLVDKNKIEAEWNYEYYEDTDDIPTEEEAEKGYNPPEYFFKVIIRGQEAESGLLEFKDWVEIELLNERGEPVPNADYVLYLADGSQKQGKLDANGYAREEDVPPGKTNFEFPNL